MKSISSVDLHYLIEEMQVLVNGRVDKIYHPKKEEILIQLHVAGKGKNMIRIISGKFIFMSEFKEKYESPGGFAMFLRKKLENSRLRKISQIGSERVVLIVFETKEEKLNLYVELYGKGNVVLTDSTNKILNALEHRKWADRDIKKGLEYSFPKKGFDIFDLKKNDFEKLMKETKEIVLKLAKDVGLGGVFAEEICFLSSIEKDRKVLDDEETDKVWKNFGKVIKSKINAEIIYEKEKVKDIVPFSLKIYEGFEKKKCDSFNSCFDLFFKDENKEEFTSKHQKEIDKAKKIVEQQEKQISEMEKKAVENNKKGELIYENYQTVEEILREINKAKEKFSFDEIKNKLKNHKVIKEVDGKEKKVVVEL